MIGGCENDDDEDSGHVSSGSNNLQTNPPENEALSDGGQQEQPKGSSVLARFAQSIAAVYSAVPSIGEQQQPARKQVGMNDDRLVSISYC